VIMGHMIHTLSTSLCRHVRVACLPPRSPSDVLAFTNKVKRPCSFCIYVFIWHKQVVGFKASATFPKKSSSQQAKFDTIASDFDTEVYKKMREMYQRGVSLCVCVSGVRCVCLSVCLSVYLPACLPACVRVCVCVCLCVCIHHVHVLYASLIFRSIFPLHFWSEHFFTCPCLNI